MTTLTSSQASRLSQPYRVLVPALLALALLAAIAQWLGTFASLENIWRDTAFGTLRASGPVPVANDVVIIAIDDAFLESVPEPLSLMHPHLGKLFSALAKAKPAVVGLDLVLPHKSFRDMHSPGVTNYDLALLSGLRDLATVAPVILSQTWDGVAGRYTPILVDYIATAQLATPGASPLASPIVCEDGDGVVRRYPGASCQPTTAAVPLIAAMAARMGNDQRWSGQINYTLGAPMSVVRLADVLDWAARGDDARLRASFGGRAVLLGGVFDFEDRHTLPVALYAAEPGEHKVPGVLLQAQIWRSLMNGGLLRETPLPLAVLLVAASALAGLGRSRPGKLLAALAGMALITGLTLFALSRWGWLLPLGGMLTTAALAMLLRGGLDLRALIANRRALMQGFSGMVSPLVLKEIAAGRLRPGMAGEQRRACVLFADVRGFTRLSTELPADTLVAVVNAYYAAVTPAIHAAGGMVDKYLGDGVMALFGAPQALDDPARKALECAQEMLLAIQALNRDHRRRGLPELAIGIGLHLGDVVVGPMGSAERHEYTAIGLTVNTAARLEAMTKELGYPIVLSATVAEAVRRPPELVDCGTHAIRGVGELNLYGWRPAALDPTPGPDQQGANNA